MNILQKYGILLFMVASFTVKPNQQDAQARVIARLEQRFNQADLRRLNRYGNGVLERNLLVQLRVIPENNPVLGGFNPVLGEDLSVVADN